MVLSIWAREMSISASAPYTGAMRTRIDIASFGAGPASPFNIARSRSDNSTISVNYNAPHADDTTCARCVAAACLRFVGADARTAGRDHHSQTGARLRR